MSGFSRAEMEAELVKLERVRHVMFEKHAHDGFRYKRICENLERRAAKLQSRLTMIGLAIRDREQMVKSGRFIWVIARRDDVGKLIPKIGKDGLCSAKWPTRWGQEWQRKPLAELKALEAAGYALVLYVPRPPTGNDEIYNDDAPVEVGETEIAPTVKRLEPITKAQALELMASGEMVQSPSTLEVGAPWFHVRWE